MSRFRNMFQSLSNFVRKKDSEILSKQVEGSYTEQWKGLMEEDSSERGYVLRMNQIEDFAGEDQERRRSLLVFSPYRRLVIWGRDSEGNPSFLYLYGTQEKKKRSDELQEGAIYHAMKISSGAGGRFPSQRLSDNRTDSGSIDLRSPIALPYFDPMYYHRLVDKINGYRKDRDSFFPVRDYNEILEFSEDCRQYVGIVTEMIQNALLYKRKKLLSLLWSMQPPIQVWERLIEIGSAELVSGIWMLFAKKQDERLLSLAEDLIRRGETVIFERELHQEKVLRGVRESAKQYLDSFSQEAKKERREIAAEYVRGIFDELSKGRNSVCLTDTAELKHRLQDMEVFGCPDLLGKLAFLVDNRKIDFKERGGFLYFHRRIRRIADEYETDSEQDYIIFLYNMMSAYAEPSKDERSVPIFLKKYLYTDYFRQEIRSQTDWYRKKTEVLPSVLLMQRNRLEEKKEVWDENLPLLINLLFSCKEELILRFIEKIFFDHPRKREFVAEFAFEQVMALSEIDYAPIADFFRRELENRPFEPVQLLYLLFSPKEEKYRSVIEARLASFGEQEYLACIAGIFGNAFDIWHRREPLGEFAKSVLEEWVPAIRRFSPERKQELLRHLESLEEKVLQESVQTDLLNFTERVIFSLSEEVIKESGKGARIEHLFPQGHRVNRLIHLMQEQGLPQVSLLDEILINGQQETVARLGELLYERKHLLKEEPSLLLRLVESGASSLEELALIVIEQMEGPRKEETLKLWLDSPMEKAYSSAFRILERGEAFQKSEDLMLRMLEHGSHEVRAYASRRMRGLLSSMREKASVGEHQAEVLLYYIRGLLFLPNRLSKSKAEIYDLLPDFLKLYPQGRERVEAILLDIGGSNVKRDSERALVALARIRKGEGA